VPPFSAPLFHTSEITLPEVPYGLFARFSGASGFVKIVAPLP